MYARPRETNAYSVKGVEDNHQFSKNYSSFFLKSDK